MEALIPFLGEMGAFLLLALSHQQEAEEVVVEITVLDQVRILEEVAAVAAVARLDLAVQQVRRVREILEV